ncbi:hypothetical protein D3C80_951940 [compost metagenome]
MQPILLRLLQPFGQVQQLLLQPGELPAKTIALFLRLLPVLCGQLYSLFAGRLPGTQLFSHLHDLLFAKQRQPLRTLFAQSLLCFLTLLLQALLLRLGLGVAFFQQAETLVQQCLFLLRLLLLCLQCGQPVFSLLYRLGCLLVLQQTGLSLTLLIVAVA